MTSTEASLLDHRDLNTDLAVFATHPLAGAGLPLWLPAGAVIRDELQALARDIARAHGGDIVLDRSALGGLKATIRLPV